MTHLNNISKVYMEKVAKPDFLDLDKDGNKKEPMKKAAVEAPKERLKTDRDGYRVPKKDADAARERLLAKARAKRAKMSEALDPVGKEDADVDNDGKKNTKSDKYLLNRRKAISKAMKEAKNIHGEIENPSTDLKGNVKKAVKRIDTNVSGDVNKKDKTMGDYGEFVPTPDGKKVTKIAKESFSNWRNDLREVMGEDGEEKKQVKEKNVKNTIKINPKISEEVTILESTEMDEVDLDIYIVYDELVQEGYDVYDIEDAIEYALVEVSDRYYDSAVKASKQAAAKKNREELKKKAVGRLRYMKRKAGEAVSSAKKKVGMASAKAQVAAYNKGREVAQTAGDKVRRAKKAVSDAPQKAKSGIKSKIKKAAQKVVDRMSEENNMEMTPSEVSLQKRKTMIDMAISQKRKQSLNKVNKEEVELDERTRYAKETGKDYTTGKPSVKGGEEPPSAMKHLQKKFRSSGGMMSSRKKPIPIPGKKKEKGAKPKFKTAPTPVDKIKAKLAKKRAPKKDPYGYGQGRYQGD